jgi:hypothetical protein
VSAEIVLPADAVSGVYLLRLDDKASHRSSFVSFVVRDDARQADLIAQRSDFTDAAYNNWDGAGNKSSWYLGSPVVTLDRPLRTAAALGGLFSYSAGYFTYEYPMIRWLEREGYDVKYVSNSDVDARPLSGGKAFLSIGHDEYWTDAMRDHVEGARDAGMHLGFFSSDAVDGEIRFLDAHTFTPASLTGYRSEFGNKPLDLTRPPHDNPSDSLTGTHYVTWCGATHLDCLQGGDGQPFARLSEPDDFFLTDMRHPALRALRFDGPAVLRRVVGYEYELPFADPQRLPFPLVILGRATQVHTKGGMPVMVAYQTNHGARVFNAGSMHWVHALDPWSGRRAFRHQGNGGPCRANEPDCFDSENRAAQQLTANVLADFGAVPATPSTRLQVSAACDWRAPEPRCLR